MGGVVAAVAAVLVALALVIGLRPVLNPNPCDIVSVLLKYDGVNVLFCGLQVTLTRVAPALIGVADQLDLILRFASAKYFSRFESDIPGLPG